MDFLALASTVTNSVGHALKKAQYILRLTMDVALRNLDLTTPQYEVLSALAEKPGLSGAALARHCFVTPQTMTGILNNLEAAGLIARAPDPDHRRIIQIRLTPQAADLFVRARQAVQQIEERMVADIDRAEREALVDLLLECANSLEQR